MSTPTIHDVDNYGRHSVMPGAEHGESELSIDEAKSKTEMDLY